ncbi:hypothetical protein EDB85DRAFT_1244967 [Lactarius pseudohatsudake]|nr:hypothetical protein EDB85DRAFT_1244967 [Lactarius pseudohatsudake]
MSRRPPRCPRPQPPTMSSRPSQCPTRCGSTRRVASAQIAPNEPNIVIRSAFRRGHRARRVGLGELERRENEANIGAGAGDGAGTTTSLGTGSDQSLSSGSGERQGMRDIARFPMDRRSNRDRAGERWCFSVWRRLGGGRSEFAISGMRHDVHDDFDIFLARANVFTQGTSAGMLRCDVMSRVDESCTGDGLLSI